MRTFAPIIPQRRPFRHLKNWPLIANSGKFVWELFLPILLAVAPMVVFGQAPAIVYQTPQSYPVNTPVTPLAPTNTGGAVPANGYGQVTTLAGGTKGSNNGLGKAASFYNPLGLAIDQTGNLYVCDTYNYLIRKITPGGAVNTFAGNGSQGDVNGAGTNASFNYPFGLAIDNLGNLFVSDQGNVIRKITPSAMVSTFAGNGNQGYVDGPGPLASFSDPAGISIDASGNIYVTDPGNNAIRVVTPAGSVSTLTGGGMSGYVDGPVASAKFAEPLSVSADNSGNLFVMDQSNLCIRKISSSGIVSTFAGAGATGPLATLQPEGALTVDNAGNLYIAEEWGQQIEKITPAGVFSVVAGSGTGGFADGIGKAARFNGPENLIADNKGNLFVADVVNSAIRKISLTGYFINKPLPPGLTFDSSTGVISGTPTALSPATDYIVTVVNGAGSSSTTVNIQITDAALKASIITLPPPILTLDGNGDYNPHATSTNNETPIVYTSSNPAVAVIDATGLVHVVGPGVSVITATQAGNSDFSPASPVTEILTVTESQVIQFPSFTSVSICNQDFSAGATSTNPDIPLSFVSSNPLVATVSAQGIIHIVGAGTTTITASQAGNSLFTPAPPQSQVLTVTSPVAPVVSIVYVNNSSICEGTPANFSATVSNGNNDVQYQWQVNGTNTGSNSATLSLTTLTSSDKIQCVVTNNGVCPVSATSNMITGINVIPYTTPSISIQSSAPGSVCSGSSITFTATSSGAGINPVYQWQVNGVNAGTNSAIFTSNNWANGDLVNCIITGNGSPCLTVSSATSNKIIVSVNALSDLIPSVTISPDGFDACEGMALTYTATAINAGSSPSYQWMVNGQNAGTNAPAFTSSTLKTGDMITCTVTSSIPCGAAAAISNAASLTADPYINNAVTISSTAAGNIISPGEQVTFTAQTTAGVSASTTLDYSWQINGVSAGTDAAVFTTSSLKNGDVVSCVVTTTGKCIATPLVYSNQIKMLVVTPVTVVNTFTPNADGVNDTWDIPTLAAYPTCTINVFTRYGTLVYNTNGYPGGWDGTYKGKPLPAGSYYYIIDLKNGSAPLSGSVTIIR